MTLTSLREQALLAPRRRRPRPKTLVALSALVLAALSLPLIFLLLEASDAGASKVWHLIWRSLTATLLWNTVRLTVVVTVLCAVVGTFCAYCVERTDLPGRHVWAVLVVIPFAIPDFVVSFGWNSLFSWVSGFRGAVIVMTLAVYPLVYLPVAASFRGADTAQEEIARSLGASRLSIFCRVTLGQARRSILGGCLLVSTRDPGRVRRLRDPGVPHLHNRDLLGVLRRLRHGVGVRPLAGHRRVLDRGHAGRGCSRRRSTRLALRSRRRAGAYARTPRRRDGSRSRALRCPRHGRARRPGRIGDLLDVPGRRRLDHRRLPSLGRPHDRAVQRRAPPCSRHSWPFRSRSWSCGARHVGRGRSRVPRSYCSPCPASSSPSRCRTSPNSTPTASATRPRPC